MRAGGDASQLIDRLAAAEHVSVFAGAGISVEAGLPSWSTLVERLLQRMALQTEAFRERRDVGNSQADQALASAAQQFADATLRSSGAIAAASMVKAHLGDEYLSVVADTLYGAVDVRTLAPGPTALAIAEFVLNAQDGSRPMVLTTNYDRLLEMAFEQLLGPGSTNVAGTLPGEDPGDADAVVVHLHGILDERRMPHERPSGPIVLAEDEFLAPGDRGPLLNDALRAELMRGPCVFLGTSMTDPNVLRILYELRQDDVAHQYRHATVAVAQTSSSTSVDKTDVVLAALRESAASRLADANVEVLFVDTYAQASQVFAELALQRAAAGLDDRPPYAAAPWRVTERARSFEQRALAAGLLPAASASRDAFHGCQTVLQHRLAEAVLRVRGALDEVPALRSTDEQLALHLWVHSPSRDFLALIGHSDRLSFNPATVQAAAARLPTSYLVVEAFCNGTVVEASHPALRSARWGSMLAIPLSLSERIEVVDAAARLPVGVLVLASTKRGPAGMERLRNARVERAGLIGALRQLGSELIDALLAPHEPPAAGDPLLRTLMPVGFDAERDVAGSAPGLGGGTHISGAPMEGPSPGRWESVATQSA